MTKAIHYLCRIDTSKYAGNFERQMVAFITSQLGECGVGSRFAEAAEEQLSQKDREWFEEYVEQVGDDHGCFRPASIMITPGWSNDGHGNHFHNENFPFPAYQSVAIRFCEEPLEEIKTLINERARLFTVVGNKIDPMLGKRIQVSNVSFFKVEVVETMTPLE